MFIDITLIGEVEQGKAIRRSGAKPGDTILVTGYPGQAAAGLQLLLHLPDDSKLLEHPLVKAYNIPSHRARLGEAIAKAGGHRHDRHQRWVFGGSWTYLRREWCRCRIDQGNIPR